MFVPSIPCAQIPQFPPNGQAAWDRKTGLGCPGVCGCSGMGLFDSGFDPTTWGWAEWLTVAGGLYVAFSLLFTTKRAASAVARMPSDRRKRRAASLRRQASELTRKKKGGGLF